MTTTSGLAWKIPGRVGDSPILGAGLYVDGDVGAAGSTGRGEANLYNLASFLIVEEMRRGKPPKDAGMEALQPHQGQHDREAAAERPRRAELQHQLLRPERARASTPASRCTTPASGRSPSATRRARGSRRLEPLLQGAPE